MWQWIGITRRKSNSKNHIEYPYLSLCITSSFWPYVPLVKTALLVCPLPPSTCLSIFLCNHLSVCLNVQYSLIMFSLQFSISSHTSLPLPLLFSLQLPSSLSSSPIWSSSLLSTPLLISTLLSCPLLSCPLLIVYLIFAPTSRKWWPGRLELALLETQR